MSDTGIPITGLPASGTIAEDAVFPLSDGDTTYKATKATLRTQLGVDDAMATAESAASAAAAIADGDTHLFTQAVADINLATIDVRSRGAVCDGVTDDTAAIVEAIADASARGGGSVVISGPTGFDGVIEVPMNVNIIGYDATQPRDNNTPSGEYASARLVALDDGCQVRYWPSDAANHHSARGGRSGGFMIDGAGYEPAEGGLLHIAHSISRMFVDIVVFDVDGDGMRIDRSQNSTYGRIIVARCSGNALTLDRGAANNLFYGSHFRASAGWHLYLDNNNGNTGSVTNTMSERTVNNLFVRCNFEGDYPPTGTNTGLLRVPPGDTHPTRSSVTFLGCAFSDGGTNRLLLEGGRTTLMGHSSINAGGNSAIQVDAGAHLIIDNLFVENASAVIAAEGGTVDLGALHLRRGNIPVVGGSGITTNWTTRSQRTTAVVLDGSTGNGPSTPDSALNPTDAMSLMMWVRAADYTPSSTADLASIWNGVGARSWAWTLVNTGRLRFRVRNSGDSANIDFVTTAPVSLTDGAGYWLAATFIDDDGDGNAEVRFFTSQACGPDRLPRSDQWELVEAVGTTGTVTLNDVAEPLWLGSEAAGGTLPFTGRIARFVQTSDVNTDGTPGSTITADWRGGPHPFTDSAGRAWTMSGSAWSWADEHGI